MTINSRMTVDIRGRIASLTLCRPDREKAALEWGILNQVVNDSDFLAEAEPLAEQLAQGPAFLGKRRPQFAPMGES